MKRDIESLIECGARVLPNHHPNRHHSHRCHHCHRCHCCHHCHCHRHLLVFGCLTFIIIIVVILIFVIDLKMTNSSPGPCFWLLDRGWRFRHSRPQEPDQFSQVTIICVCEFLYLCFLFLFICVFVY